MKHLGFILICLLGFSSVGQASNIIRINTNLGATSRLNEHPENQLQNQVTNEGKPDRPPTDIQIRVVSESKLRISWQDNSNNELNFLVERSYNKITWHTLAEVLPDTTYYVDKELEHFHHYYYRVRANFNSGLSSATDAMMGRTAMAPYDITGLPAPWKRITLGEEYTPTYFYSYSNDTTYTIDAGTGGLSDTLDRTHFVYQTLKGDGEIIAQVVNFAEIHYYSQAGLMMRESLSDASKFAAQLLLGGPGPAMRYRDSTKGIVGEVPYNTKENAPMWLKLKRLGNTFSGYYLNRREFWVKLKELEIPMRETIYVGITASTWDNEATGIYSFTNLEVYTIQNTSRLINSSISVYPNPSTGLVTVERSNWEGSMNYEIIALNGKTVDSGKLQQAKSQLKLSQLKSGIYFLKVEGLHKSYTRKIVISK